MIQTSLIKYRITSKKTYTVCYVLGAYQYTVDVYLGSRIDCTHFMSSIYTMTTLGKYACIDLIT